ncbi:MAG: hypothetical protein R6T89_06015 [Candidatus Syntrophosphaera sp.]
MLEDVGNPRLIPPSCLAFRAALGGAIDPIVINNIQEKYLHFLHKVRVSRDARFGVMFGPDSLIVKQAAEFSLVICCRAGRHLHPGNGGIDVGLIDQGLFHDKVVVNHDEVRVGSRGCYLRSRWCLGNDDHVRNPRIEHKTWHAT